MITNAIIDIISGLVNAIFAALPAWDTLPTEPEMESFRSVFWNVDGWVPVTELAQVVGLYGTVWVGMLALKWMIKMVGLIRGGG